MISVQNSAPGLEVRSFNEAAEAFLTLSLAHGADHVFINPGTDTFPIQEAWAKYREQNVPAPRPVMCTHEHVAVSAAHGYYQATGRPQIVIVHVDCGTINAGGALHNAQRGEAGIVFCAGRAPYTWEGELPGSKSSPIHWYQEQADQAGIVRNFVKWHYEMSRSENIGGIMERAFQVAANDPPGPVYLTLPREVLMLPSANVPIPDARRMNRVSPPAADFDAIKKTASLLAGAKRPLIVAGRNGRYIDSVPELVRVAELLGARVCDSREYVNMPASHPLNVGPGLNRELPDADAVVFLDTDIPYVPITVRPATEAAIIHINVEPAHEEYVIWNFPADVRIAANPTTALRQLYAELYGTMTDSQRKAARLRAEEIGAEQLRQRAAAEVRARSKGTAEPLDGEWVIWNLKQLMPEGSILLDEGMSGGATSQDPPSRGRAGNPLSPGWLQPGLGAWRGNRPQAGSPRPNRRLHHGRWLLQLWRPVAGPLDGGEGQGAVSNCRIQ